MGPAPEVAELAVGAVVLLVDRLRDARAGSGTSIGGRAEASMPSRSLSWGRWGEKRRLVGHSGTCKN